LDVGFRTDIGRRRTVNEDALLVLPKHGLFAVCDGVGGRSSGEVASRLAVAGIEGYFRDNPVAEAEGYEGEQRHEWFRTYFHRCLQRINMDILGLSARDPSKEGMATTAVIGYLDNDMLYVTNIGDSRAYLIRTGALMQVTQDHSYVNSLVNQGTISRAEARIHPQKNVITRALGVGESAECDFYWLAAEKGDRLLLSTDGMHGELMDEEILAYCSEGNDLNAICRLLVKAANDRGGGDNITVVLVAV
jgi:protein phosphatase